MGNIQPGDTVLIHSVAGTQFFLQISSCFLIIPTNYNFFLGGVGCAATQLAKTVADVVIVGTASASKHEKLKENGEVSHVLHHKNYVTQAKNVSPQGYDLIIDCIGGPNIEISQTLLKPCGRLVIIGKYYLNTFFLFSGLH